MSTINDGGSAFPAKRARFGTYGEDIANPIQVPGMTLRDYFAAKALVGVCSMVATNTHDIKDDNALATDCYRMADAMLKARLK